MSKAIDAWNATVTGAAQIGTLSVIMQGIYGALFMAIGGWLLISVYDQFCKKKMSLHDSGTLLFRWLGLMMFTFFYLS
ncbi:hypothetical protein [Photobacterium leiognathi]|uniref:hypothetical protein n=1 Tax=Photobacterium leiognathi TaxID=553611 RepID=UPI002982A23E|nr:hypothetical protein [Photobacterium leiognathi]